MQLIDVVLFAYSLTLVEPVNKFKGLITWAGLARLAGLLRCAENRTGPVDM